MPHCAHDSARHAIHGERQRAIQYAAAVCRGRGDEEGGAAGHGQVLRRPAEQVGEAEGQSAGAGQRRACHFVAGTPG